MAYTKTSWFDRIVQFPMRFTKSGETSTSVTLTTDPGTITQAGTPINAANLNKLEQGVQDAHTTADAALPSASYTAADVLTKIKTVDGSGSGLDADVVKGVNILAQNQSTHANAVGLSESLKWKNFGNGHVIFDASAGTSPDGTAVNNANSQSVWQTTYGSLMGWNGANTFGVRVDSARNADTAGDVQFRKTSGYIEWNNAGTWQGVGGMKNVQRGVATLGVSLAVTISAVNMSKSFVTCSLRTGFAYTDPPQYFYTVRLTSSTNLQIEGYGPGNGDRFVAWEVVEFY